MTAARSGAAPTGVVSVASLSAGLSSAPPLPSSLTVAVLETVSKPAGSAESTVTSKAIDVDSPASSVPRSAMQVLPAGAPLEQDQSAVGPAKVVPSGTVSLTATPEAPWLPTLSTVIV